MTENTSGHDHVDVADRAAVRAAPSRRRRLLALTGVVLLLIVLPAWYVFARTDTARTVRADFEYVNGIYPGSPVTVLGVAVGTVTEVVPQGTSVRVTMTVPEEVRLPADVSAYVLSPAVISDRHIELGPAYTDGPRFEDGGLIGVDRTRSPIDVDGMLSSMSTLVEALGPDGGDLGTLLADGARTWDGEGERFHDAVRDLSAASGVVAGTTEDMTALTETMIDLVHALDARQISVDSTVEDLSALSSLWSEQDHDITGQLEDLRTVLTEVDEFVRTNGDDLGTIGNDLRTVGDTLADHRVGLAEFLDVVPLMMQNLTDTVGPDGRSRIRLNVSTNLTQFEVAGPLCAQNPLPLCTGAGFTNPISFPISASDPLGIVSAVTGAPGGPR